MYFDFKDILQHFKFVNWRIREFVFWCHEQVSAVHRIRQRILNLVSQTNQSKRAYCCFLCQPIWLIIRENSLSDPVILNNKSKSYYFSMDFIISQLKQSQIIPMITKIVLVNGEQHNLTILSLVESISFSEVDESEFRSRSVSQDSSFSFCCRLEMFCKKKFNYLHNFISSL